MILYFDKKKYLGCPSHDLDENPIIKSVKNIPCH
jgi:hypothetical protein